MYVVEDDDGGRPNPLHYLFSAILDRALKDLTSKDKHVRRETIQWFDTWENTLPHGISYKDICEHLELSVYRREKITLLLHTLC